MEGKIKEGKELAKEFVEFMENSKTSYHIVGNVIKQLHKKGFKEVKETEQWKIEPNGKYFFQRNHSSLFAFTVGGKFECGNGFKIVLAHTDSPCLRMKPKSSGFKEGYQMFITPYGGGLFRNWFDRDLTIAGKVLIKNDKGNIETKLVDLKKPLLIIPSLAIHLETTRDKFEFNKENHLYPVLSSFTPKDVDKKSNHHQDLLKLVCQGLKCKVEDIVDFELDLVDCQKPCMSLFVVNEIAIGGLYDDMIFSHGLDNKFTCFTLLKGMVKSLKSIKEDKYCRISAFFDNEEVGSLSRAGAKSPTLNRLIKRVMKILRKKETPKDYYDMAIAKSFVISSDNAHAVHPNYSSCHHPNFKPVMNKGIVIKINISTRYSTNVVSLALLKQLMEKNNIPYQLFQVKNDSRCGSTVGPTTSTVTGCRSIDIGAAQLSMHSIRETCGSLDVKIFSSLFEVFFNQFEEKTYLQ